MKLRSPFQTLFHFFCRPLRSVAIAAIVTLSITIANLLSPALSAEIGTVDPIPAKHQAGQTAYLANCATCHIGIPPAIFPTQTWKELLSDPQHYGATLTPIGDPDRYLVWNYLKFASRQVLPEERVPYRVRESKAFKILHPNVQLPKPLDLSSCITCHPGTNQFNFRSLKEGM